MSEYVIPIHIDRHQRRKQTGLLRIQWVSEVVVKEGRIHVYRVTRLTSNSMPESRTMLQVYELGKADVPQSIRECAVH